MSDPSVSPNSTWDFARAKEFLLSLKEEEFLAFREAFGQIGYTLAQYHAENIDLPPTVEQFVQSGRKIEAIKELRRWYQEKGTRISLMVAKLAVEKHMR